VGVVGGCGGWVWVGGCGCGWVGVGGCGGCGGWVWVGVGGWVWVGGWVGGGGVARRAVQAAAAGWRPGRWARAQQQELRSPAQARAQEPRPQQKTGCQQGACGHAGASRGQAPGGRTFCATSSLTWPCRTSTPSRNESLKAACRRRPLRCRCASPPCSRSISTTTSLTWRPSFCSRWGGRAGGWVGEEEEGGVRERGCSRCGPGVPARGAPALDAAAASGWQGVSTVEPLQLAAAARAARPPGGCRAAFTLASILAAQPM
jgi:hypothetical protein